jgi:AcrR family transcriptional regulator
MKRGSGSGGRTTIAEAEFRFHLLHDMTTPDATQRPLRADARRNRDKIVAAARDAFSEDGLDAQIEDVARRAGVGVGTVYRHFPTKDALVRALVVDKMEEMTAMAPRFLAEAERDGWEAFTGFVRACADTHVSDRGLSQVISTQPAESFVDVAMDTGLMRATGRLLVAAQESGVARRDLVATDVGVLMCGLSAVLESFGEAGGRRYLEMMLDGMRNSEAPRLPAAPRVARPRD